jgi:hypothetical protein
MNQHDLWRRRYQRLKARAHGNLARRAAKGSLAHRKAGARSRKTRFVVAMDHRLHRVDVRMRDEARQRTPNHRRTVEQTVLFG